MAFGTKTARFGDRAASALAGFDWRNVIASLMFLFVLPSLWFLAIFSARSGRSHYDNERYTEILIGIGVAIVLAIFWVCWKRHSRGEKIRWQLATAVLLTSATICGVLWGDHNYFVNMQSYYDYTSLAEYVNVNPGQERGQTFMDAGTIYFKTGARIDEMRTMQLKNLFTYCVAPITSEELTTGEEAKSPPAGTLDFWAVGLNCCGPGYFHCGEAKEPFARSGLRVLRDDIRPFYQMAVDQWTAKYKIPSAHPIFLTWVHDPVVAVKQYHLRGDAFYKGAVFIFVFTNFLIAVGTIVLTVYLRNRQKELSVGRFETSSATYM